MESPQPVPFNSPENPSEAVVSVSESLEGPISSASLPNSSSPSPLPSPTMSDTRSGSPVPSPSSSSSHPLTVTTSENSPIQSLPSPSPIPSSSIETSPEFLFLTSLELSHSLYPSQVDDYKLQYRNLHSTLMSSLASESRLLSLVGPLQTRVDAAKVALVEKQNSIQVLTKNNSELQGKEKAKRAHVTKLLEEKNSLLAETEDLARNLKEVRDLLDTTQTMAAAPSSSLLLSSTSALPAVEKAIESLQDEIVQEDALIAKEVAAAVDYEQKYNELQNYISSLEKEKAKKKAQLALVEAEPERIETNIKMIENVLREISYENEKLVHEMHNVEGTLGNLQDERRSINGEVEEMGIQLENLRLGIAKRKTNLDDIRRMKDLEEQKRDSLAEKKQMAESSKIALRDASKALMNNLHETSKIFENQKKDFEKIRRRTETMKSVQKPMRDEFIDIRSRYQQKDKELKELEIKLVEVKAEEEMFIVNYLIGEEEEEKLMESNKEMDDEIHDLEKEVQLKLGEEKGTHLQLNALISSRELMSREASKAAVAMKNVKEELRVKKIILMDLNKQSMETTHKLNGCSLKYEKMKNQRNKLANLTQSSAQSIAEMKEKIKILSNECEILRAEFASKERSLQEEIRQHRQFQHMRDSLRLEQNKIVMELKNAISGQNQTLMEMIKLNAMANHAQSKLVHMKQEYSQAVDHRNSCGMRLIDRNDELAILNEKSKIQAKALNEGDYELKRKEEDIILLERDIHDIRRRIEISRSKIPSLDVYASKERELAILEKDIAKEQRLVEQLGVELETPIIPGNTLDLAKSGLQVMDLVNPANPGILHPRARELGGSDPSPEELAAKVELLEERLRGKRNLLEKKKLELESLCMESEKFANATLAAKPLLMGLANRRNFVQSEIRRISKSMISMVSELAMYQMECNKLEIIQQERNNYIQLARDRVNQGLPPTEDSAWEWTKMERERLRLHENMLNGINRRDQERKEGHLQHLSIVKSTAEPRPDSYVTLELGLPKPYSHSLPAFKATPATLGQIRHFRAPKDN